MDPVKRCLRHLQSAGIERFTEKTTGCMVAFHVQFFRADHQTVQAP